MAKAAGISQPVLSEIEHGQYTSLRVTVLLKLAGFLQLSYDEILPPPPADTGSKGYVKEHWQILLAAIKY